MAEPLLSVRRLSIGIRSNKKTYTAVDKVSFDVYPGEILGIVGESGCGKSITAMSLMGLLSSGVSVTGGNAFFEGRDLLSIKGKERLHMNGNRISMIYQEPMTSLNPLMKIGRQIGEPLRLHTDLPEKEIRARAREMLDRVGMRDGDKIFKSYPHQLSGGMRQRVMIAMAAIANPALLIADEPTTALDVTTQAEILELLRKMNRDHGTSIIFISHDLGVVGRICSRVLVMYAGRLVESGPSAAILGDPEHPYTEGLIASIPEVEDRGEDLPSIPGRVPSVTEEHAACPFAPRCGKATALCSKIPAPMRNVGPDHFVWCHNVHGGSR